MIQKLSTLLVFLTIICICWAKKFTNTMPKYIFNSYYFPLTEETTSTGRVLSIYYPEVNYEISYELYIK